MDLNQSTSVELLLIDRVEKQLKTIEEQLPQSRSVQTGGELRKLEGHEAPVRHAIYLADGARVLTEAGDTFKHRS
jgi:hypothetical protein